MFATESGGSGGRRRSCAPQGEVEEVGEVVEGGAVEEEVEDVNVEFDLQKMVEEQLALEQARGWSMTLGTPREGR